MISDWQLMLPEFRCGLPYEFRSLELFTFRRVGSNVSPDEVGCEVAKIETLAAVSDCSGSNRLFWLL